MPVHILGASPKIAIPRAGKTVGWARATVAMTKWDSRVYHGQEPAHRGGGVRLSDALAQSTEVCNTVCPFSAVCHPKKEPAGTGPGLRPQTQLETEQGLLLFSSFSHLTFKNSFIFIFPGFISFLLFTHISWLLGKFGSSAQEPQRQAMGTKTNRGSARRNDGTRKRRIKYGV